MGAIDDIVAQLMGSKQPAAPVGDPLVIAPQVAPSPVIAGDPMVITPNLPAAGPAAHSKGESWVPPAPTMTAPAVTPLPTSHAMGMIAAMPAPTVSMGDTMAPTPQRRRVVLPV